MFKTNALGAKKVFLSKGWTGPYLQYGEESTATKNTIKAQNLSQTSWLCWYGDERAA